MRVLSTRWTLLLLAIVLPAIASLPQILPVHQIVDHQDPLFSMWRMAWLGHALADDPSRLFHGNIFYPHPYSLTYSDAVLLQGVTNRVLTFAGLSFPVAYNLLIWISFPLSALTMFLLAEKVSGSAWAALPAALAYSLSAYRFDHIMHLEQIWTQWLPLHVYLAMRAYERATWRSALAVGVSLLVQMFSCLYLLVFGMAALPVAAVGQFVAARRIPWRALGRIAGVCILLIAPPAAAYARIYTLGLRDVGARPYDEVLSYSADLGSFFASPARNVLFGWTEIVWGGVQEQQLFPGLVVSALAIIALTRVRGPYIWALAALTAFAIVMALGANGPLYPLFYEWVPGYANLRVPTRFGAFLSLGVAGLAACGLAPLLERRVPTSAAAVVAVLSLLVLAETATGLPYRRSVPERPTAVDQYLAARPGAVAIEYPFATTGNLPSYDHLYTMRSVHHWRPIVNGYSGNYPPEYLRLLDDLEASPPGSSAWIDLLRKAGATHLIVHTGLVEPDITGALLFELERRKDVESVGQLACWPDRCGVYQLTPGGVD